jgi:hypothetical protein
LRLQIVRTYPQKIREREKAKLAKLPAFSAVSCPATAMTAKVAVKIMNIMTYNHMRAPLTATVSVGTAFR